MEASEGWGADNGKGWRWVLDLLYPNLPLSLKPEPRQGWGVGDGRGGNLPTPTVVAIIQFNPCFTQIYAMFLCLRYCVELELTGLAINTVLQSHHVNDFEGADATSVTFDAMPQSSVQEMVTSGQG